MPKNGASNEPTFQRNPQGPSGVGGRLSGRPQARSFNWDHISPDDIAFLVKHVTGAGCGIVLGCTSDGGALSITILDGDSRVREWPASLADYERLIQWIKSAL